MKLISATLASFPRSLRFICTLIIRSLPYMSGHLSKKRRQDLKGTVSRDIFLCSEIKSVPTFWECTDGFWMFWMASSFSTSRQERMLKIVIGYTESIFTSLFISWNHPLPSLLSEITTVRVLFYSSCFEECHGMLVKSLSLQTQRISIFSLKRIHNHADKMSLWAGSFVLKHLWRSSVNLVCLFTTIFLLFFRRVLCTCTPAYPSSCPSSHRTSIQSTSGQTNTFLFIGPSRGSFTQCSGTVTFWSSDPYVPLSNGSGCESVSKSSVTI